MSSVLQKCYENERISYSNIILSYDSGKINIQQLILKLACVLQQWWIFVNTEKFNKGNSVRNVLWVFPIAFINWNLTNPF